MSAHPSIRRHLLAMLLATIALVWLVVLVLVYRAAQHEVEEVFDADLARSAGILQTLLLHEIVEGRETMANVQSVARELGPDVVAAYPGFAAILGGNRSEDGKDGLRLPGAASGSGQKYGAEMAFIARHSDGKVMVRDRWEPDFPPTPQGYAGVTVDGEPWRVFNLTDAGTGFVVQVGEKRALRAELVGYITRNTLAPLLAALPIIGVLLWAVVGRALAPLRRVADEVATLAPDALGPIDDRSTPQEIHGLLAALNKLFGRVESAIRNERQFTADAAHELRTPLAALKTHLQVARGQSDDAATHCSLDQALEAVDGATHSAEQLLLLARADAGYTGALVSVNLRDIAGRVVSALSQQAFQRDIDLGIDGPEVVCVHADAAALQLLLRNLVDNAVRYTPVGGTVTVGVGSDGDGAWLAVVDDGVGVPAEDRGKIFNRFHRGSDEQARGSSGSGLGLSIVRRVAELHGATIRVQDGSNGRGLSVKVIFPPA